MSTNVCIRHSTRPCTYRTVSTHYRFSFGIRRRMYNGIGLPTPRGSGTSGYIQRNLSHLKPRRTDIGSSLGGVGLDGADWGRTAQTPKVRKPNAELLEHERRRQVEIKLLYFADELRESNVSEDAIAERVAEERERLLALLNENTAEVSDKAPSKHGVKYVCFIFSSINDFVRFCFPKCDKSYRAPPMRANSRLFFNAVPLCVSVCADIVWKHISLLS